MTDLARPNHTTFDPPKLPKRKAKRDAPPARLPTTRPSLADVDPPERIVVVGAHVIVSAGATLAAVDLAQPSPRVVGTVRLADVVVAMAVHENIVFCDLGSRGIAIVDARDLTAPRVVAT